MLFYFVKYAHFMFVEFILYTYIYYERKHLNNKRWVFICHAQYVKVQIMKLITEVHIGICVCLQFKFLANLI